MNMTAKKLTIDEIRNDEKRNYNSSFWDKSIDEMINSFADVVFYLVKKGNGYDYDRHFVEYTLPEGLRLFSSFGYGGSISNGGFYRLDKLAITDDGLTYADLIELAEHKKRDEMLQLVKKLESSNLLSISYGKFYDKNGNECLYGHCSTSRATMSELSKKYGITFSKG